MLEGYRSRYFWLFAFFLSLSLHMSAMFILLHKAKKDSIEIGGFEAQLSNSFQSVMLVSNLPIGEVKEFSQNSKKSKITPQNQKTQTKQQKSSSISNEEQLNSSLMSNKNVDAKKPNTTQKSKETQEKSHTQATPSQDKNIEKDSTLKDSIAQAQLTKNDEKNSSIIMGSKAKEIKSYQGLLAAHLNRFKKYPNEAIINKEEGIIVVKISLDSDGNILERNIKTPCIFKSLNNDVINLLQRASPLPKPPQDMLRNGILTFSMPIKYSLKDIKQ